MGPGSPKRQLFNDNGTVAIQTRLTGIAYEKIKYPEPSNKFGSILASMATPLLGFFRGKDAMVGHITCAGVQRARAIDLDGQEIAYTAGGYIILADGLKIRAYAAPENEEKCLILLPQYAKGAREEQQKAFSLSRIQFPKIFLSGQLFDVAC